MIFKSQEWREITFFRSSYVSSVIAHLIHPRNILRTTTTTVNLGYFAIFVTKMTWWVNLSLTFCFFFLSTSSHLIQWKFITFFFTWFIFSFIHLLSPSFSLTVLPYLVCPVIAKCCLWVWSFTEWIILFFTLSFSYSSSGIKMVFGII